MLGIVLVILAVIIGGGLAIAYARYKWLDATADYRSIKAARLLNQATKQLEERTAQAKRGDHQK